MARCAYASPPASEFAMATRPAVWRARLTSTLGPIKHKLVFAVSLGDRMRGKAAGSRSPLTLKIKGLGARCDFCRERLPLVQRDVEQMEHQSAERLANLLTLSYEPMLAWRLGGAIEFWNAGAER